MNEPTHQRAAARALERSRQLSTASVSTPAILVEGDRLRHNIRAMAEFAQQQGVALRPHVKTHRSCTIADLQRQHGARGLTCAKPAEAEVFQRAGFTDLLIAYSLGDPAQLQHVASLSRRSKTSFCVESVAGVRRAAEVLTSHGQDGAPIDVLLELDTGYGRAGVGWQSQELQEVAAAARTAGSLRLVGVLTHAGHAYSVDARQVGEAGDDPLRRIADEERDRTLAAAAAIRHCFEVDQPQLSIGSTPTMARFGNREHHGLRITEIRPGNYVFCDRTQLCIGAAELPQCSIEVLLTVVTARTNEQGHHVLLDGGKKVLTSDRCSANGYGLLLLPHERRPWPGAVIHNLSEEHAWVHIPTPELRPAVGDRLRVVPNHSCVVMSTANRVYLCSGDEIEQRLPVEARTA